MAHRPNPRISLVAPDMMFGGGHFPFDESTAEHIKIDWPLIVRRVGLALQDTMRRRKSKLGKKFGHLDIRTQADDAIDFDEDMITCGGMGCVFHAMGRDSGYVVKITKSIPEAIAYRFVQNIDELRTHPGVALPVMIFELDYIGDESIPDDEQLLFVILRQAVTPVHLIDEDGLISDDQILEDYPELSREQLDEVDDRLRETSRAAEYLQDIVNYFLDRSLAEGYDTPRKLILGVDGLDHDVRRVLEAKERLRDTIYELGEIPIAKKLADFLRRSLDHGLLLSDLRLTNVGYQIPLAKKHKPGIPSLVLFDFLSVLPEGQLERNPYSEPMILPELAMI